MNRITKIATMVGSILFFNGCVSTGTVCTAPNNKTARIEIIRDNTEQLIAKDRLDVTSEAIYKNIAVKDDKIQASISAQSRLFTWSGLLADGSIMLDSNRRTVMIGNTTYQCDNKFDGEIAKIDMEEIRRKEAEEANKVVAAAKAFEDREPEKDDDLENKIMKAM